MDTRNVPEQVKEVLKSNPRGMTVSEVAQRIDMNAQSTGRHLDVLAAAGHIDVRTFGRSKVYYLSQRVPILTMINVSQDIIIILDKDLRITKVNKKFQDFTGVAPEDIVNKSIESKTFPLRFNPDIAPYSKNAVDGKGSRIEAVFERGHNKIFFRIKFIPVLYDNGDKGAIIIIEDITERKKIEEERSFLAAIVESSYDAIIGKTLDGTVTSWNKSAERIYGYTASEMIGTNMSVLVPPDQPNEIPDILYKIRKGEQVRHFETTRVRKDGKRIVVSLTVSPIIDGSGNVLGASTIAYEVKERKAQ